VTTPRLVFQSARAAFKWKGVGYGKTVPLIREKLRQAYFDWFTSAEHASPPSSEDEEAKQERFDRVARTRGQVGQIPPLRVVLEVHIQVQMDLYVYFQYDPQRLRLDAVPPRTVSKVPKKSTRLFWTSWDEYAI
jgi:hypothetical protein